jgi:hypothetical protein
MVDGAPQRIARDATHAYVTSIGMGATAGWITAIALSGGARRVLAQLDCSPFGITTDGAFVYFTCNDGSVRSIRVPA